tara:strand:- start:236 stop:649 length:414 start_codon:yes stop_codon:yes gene_type:complete
MEKIFITFGRILLGLYFFLPGISKIPTYAGTTEYMLLHNIPMTSILLPVTIILQLVLGAFLVIGYRIKESALILAVLTIFINIGVHDFWNDYPNIDTAHETQNFVKNLGIFAGLIVLSAAHRVRQWRFFPSMATKKD